MSSGRFLTKSKFKLAIECPTKLYYSDRKREYPDRNLEDEFMLSLAKGGYQVGALAKCYFPDAITVEEIDPLLSLQKTAELLTQKDITICEGSFFYNGMISRADILVKRGRMVQLIEVKAKTIGEHSELRNNKGGISTPWKPYVMDVAFQKYVIKNAYPEWEIKAFLMLADKFSMATIDGLNQKFLTRVINGKYKVDMPINLDLGEQILTKVPIDDLIDDIFKGKELIQDVEFEEFINNLIESYKNDVKIPGWIGSRCKNCEFKTNREQEKEGFKSGIKECWSEGLGIDKELLNKPSILDIWDFRKKDEFIKKGVYFQESITYSDLEPATKKKVKDTDEVKDGLTRVERQFIQVDKAKNNDLSVFIDRKGIISEMNSWTYPLHMIDFETTAVAIPFIKGMKPYEQIAFQFSHHIIRKTKEGFVIEHAGEYINTKPGVFPNFEFVRNLKKQLEKDEGTIFRYAAHENSILNAIYIQLSDSNEPDKNELCKWIKTITKSTSGSIEVWEGKRNMVDLLELVKRFYYNPLTNGSNSIKHVLPALLNSNKYLREFYAQDIYGKDIKSLNFKNQVWISLDKNGFIQSPYKKLPKLFDDAIDIDLLEERLMHGDDLADGGAAMTVYALMQFTEMSDAEREALIKGLLKYCELDTLAMVMIWQGWYQECIKEPKILIS